MKLCTFEMILFFLILILLILISQNSKWELHSVNPRFFLIGKGRGGGIEPPTKFSKRW